MCQLLNKQKQKHVKPQINQIMPVFFQNRVSMVILWGFFLVVFLFVLRIGIKVFSKEDTFFLSPMFLNKATK